MGDAGQGGDGRRVAIVTLGCARNETDTEELAGRLGHDGWRLVRDAADADVVMVNTCGFVEAAKTESIETLLSAKDAVGDDGGRKVVAVGCLAERYGSDLAESLTEADAVLGFDDYPDISARLTDVLDGRRPPVHRPRDRRTLLPLAPAQRRSGPHAGTTPVVDGSRPPSGAGAAAYGPPVMRRRLDDSPVAPLKLASGCDRRCAFCAIPRFRGAFVSRPPEEVLAEAVWLAEHGVRELVLVSENTTSYGKDLGNLRLLERLLPDLAATPGVVRVRLSYLQPAEMRPSLVDALASTPGVAPYFDLSFQHASEPVLRRMRRFGSRERFLALLADVRRAAPDAGARTNVILGFPGETARDVAELERFLDESRLDAVGVFGYSDEDGTEAAELPGKLRDTTIRRRVERIATLVDMVVTDRARERVGSVVRVLVDSVADDGATVEGRGDHQGPDSDGSTTLRGGQSLDLRPGDLVEAVVVDAVGADLIAEVLDPV